MPDTEYKFQGDESRGSGSERHKKEQVFTINLGGVFERIFPIPLAGNFYGPFCW